MLIDAHAHVDHSAYQGHRGGNSGVAGGVRNPACDCHWYSGPPDILDDMIARGCYFTVGVDLMHSDVARLIADDPWLSDVRGRFFE